MAKRFLFEVMKMLNMQLVTLSVQVNVCYLRDVIVPSVRREAYHLISLLRVLKDTK